MNPNLKKILERVKSRKKMPAAVYGKKDSQADKDLKAGKYKIKPRA